jgi:hypothetical protein
VRAGGALDIDPEATAWLDRVLVDAPGRVDGMLALVDVWFDWPLAQTNGSRSLSISDLGGSGCSAERSVYVERRSG